MIDDFAALIRSYGVARVVGDRYAGEFPREQFRKRAIHFVCAEKAKSDLLRDLLPLLNSGRVVLPRSDRLTNQLTSLEQAPEPCQQRFHRPQSRQPRRLG